VLGSIIELFVLSFALGVLARWAVPGPDPMPIWLTAAIGFVGSVLGGGIVAAAIGKTSDLSKTQWFVAVLAQVLAGALVVVGYRRFVQKRPLTGPKALEPPTRGWGLTRRRPGPRLMSRQQALERLDELHDRGELTDEEYLERRRQVLRSH
jgi:uncharacterized membrane protein YeaQ/YmgE (transglycosylase-associated protein family)